MALEDWQTMVRSYLDLKSGEPTLRFVWWIEIYTGASDTDDRDRLSLEVVPCPEPPRGTLSHPLPDEPTSQFTLSYGELSVSMLLPLTSALTLAEQVMRLISVGEGGG